MNMEIQRQLVHLAGFLSVILAVFIGRLIVVYFFTAAAVLGIYSIYIKKERERLNLIEKMETKIREFVMKFERKNIPRPFTGAIWFFLTSGVVYLIFPLDIASAAVLMLAIGDSFSTLAGIHLGRHRIIGKKTLEGTLACFIGCLFSVFFAPLYVVIPGAVAATLAEIAPDLRIFSGMKKKGWIDDNLLIPVVAGIVMLAVTCL